MPIHIVNLTIPGPLLRPQRSRQPPEGPGTPGRGQGNAHGRAPYVPRVVLRDVREGKAGLTVRTDQSGIPKKTYHFLGSGRLETAKKSSHSETWLDCQPG